jgi:predicted RNase H-like HicB family nuclease
MLIYHVALTPDDGTLLVTCPALPEVTTFGEDRADALSHAVSAIEEACPLERRESPRFDCLSKQRSRSSFIGHFDRPASRVQSSPGA